MKRHLGAPVWKWMWGWVGSYFPAGMLLTAWIMPWIAAAAMAVAVEMNSRLPFLAGAPVTWAMIATFLLWPVIGIMYSPMTRPGRANSSSYRDLKVRIASLNERLKAVSDIGEKKKENWEGSAERAACHQAKALLVSLREYLDKPGIHWATGLGYISAWRNLHRAEEALINSYDRYEIWVQGKHDRLRLSDTDIAHGHELTEMLNDVVRLMRLADSDHSWFSPTPDELARARAGLREVRFALNEVLDSSFEGLLRLRNQTYMVLVLTETATFGLLAIAWLARVPVVAIVAGVTFFITGVTVGLFNRLREQATLDVVVLDYGLAAVRLLTLPIYSGLAALGGVVVQGLSTVQFTQGDLLAVFDLAKNPAGILVAAGFSVAPAMLFKALGDSSERFRKNISSTQATSATQTNEQDRTPATA